MPIDKDKNLKYYNENAEEYHQRNKDKDLTDLYQAFEKHLKGQRLLDLGCGTGRDAAYFCSKGYQVIGIDFSEEMLKIAKVTAPSAEFIKMDITDDLTNLGKFDGVWAMASLLHLNEQEFKETLVRIKEVLNSNAPLFISIKQEDFYDVGERDFEYWSKEKAKSAFESLGLRIVFESEGKTEKSHFWSWVLN